MKRSCNCIYLWARTYLFTRTVYIYGAQPAKQFLYRRLNLSALPALAKHAEPPRYNRLNHIQKIHATIRITTMSDSFATIVCFCLSTIAVFLGSIAVTLIHISGHLRQILNHMTLDSLPIGIKHPY